MDKPNNISSWKVGTYSSERSSERNSIEEKKQENIIYENSNSSESNKKIKNSSNKEKYTISTNKILNLKRNFTNNELK